MWQQNLTELYKSIVFKNFSEAFAFITQVALLAEQKQHHPSIKIDYNKVEIWLSTHDAGSLVTQKDIDLSKDIDKIIG